MMFRRTPTRLWLLAAAVLAAGCYQVRKDPPDGGVNVVRPGGAGGSGGNRGGSGGGGGRGAGGTEEDGPQGPVTDGFTCDPNAPCTLQDSPCLVGQTTCDNGMSGCKPTDKPQANGTACSDDSVCLDGVCSKCQRGIECPIPGNVCRVGAIECASGKPECLQVGNAPNGATCGEGQVCKDGTCSPCAAGDSCVPANPCHEGTLACAGAVASCTDTGMAKAPGSACGASKVCGATGECVACMAGMACDLPMEPCKTGKIDCSSGAPVCMAAGNTSNGTSCGAGKVCSEGMCAACSEGMSCTPTNRCHTGTLSCSTGSATCVDSNTNVANGASCGTNRYCSNGACNPCTPNVSCDSGNPCKTGTTSCDTGTSQCRESGNAPNGRGCGTGRVCNNGSCVDCMPNMSCQPSPCKVGMTSCATGSSECRETGNAPNGSSCGTNRVCNNGGCNNCDDGASCSTGNPCKRGTISCSTGTGRCMESGNVGDGTGCGGSRVCVNGACRDCNPSNAPTCRNGQRITCSGAGTEVVDNCGGNGCTGNRCNQCRPGSRQCSGNTPQTCRGDGSGYDNGQTCQVGCDGGNCRTCGGGTHQCGNQCRSNTSVESCGNRCTGCPDDHANSSPSCVNQQCSFNCDSGFMKSGDSCVPNCGAQNAACCSGDRCNNSNLICSGQRCMPCGREGQQCCGGARCATGFVCNVSECIVKDCGARGQECCGGFGGDCDGSLICDAGTCDTPCGANGQRCCSGNECNANLICVSLGGGQCIPGDP